MISICAVNCNQAFLVLLSEIFEKPDYISYPRGMETKEKINVSLEILNPRDRLVTNKYRNISLEYLVGEFIWYEKGGNLLKDIIPYSSFWGGISDDGKTCNSAYGYKVYSKRRGISNWENVKNELIYNQDSRRATLSIYGNNDLKIKGKDVPCTISLQFLIREDKLHLITTMRSNDLWIGFCYDVATFTLWQEKMLCELKPFFQNLSLGSYYHNVGSMHLYSKHYSNARDVLKHKNSNFKSLLYKTPNLLFLKDLEKLKKNEVLIQNNKSEKNLYELKDPFCNWVQEILLKKWRKNVDKNN